MTIKELIAESGFEVINEGEATEREIKDVFCCDLLSIAMSRGTEGAAWVTVMGNVNTLAVLALTEMACIVLAENIDLDEDARKKAAEQKITVMRTDMPIFKAAKKIYDLL